MTQIVQFQASNLPAALQQRLAQFNVASSLSALSGGGAEIDRISVKGSRFRIQQVGMDEVVLNQLHLDGVIVYANPHVTKAYYSKTYDPNAEDQSPDCASSNGFGPDAGVKNPQSNQCATCPQNVWGSKVSPRGAKIKACSDAQRIAFLPIDPSTNNFFMVDGKPKAFAMNIPAASMKALGIFAKTLNQRGLPLEITLARITFDPNAEFPKMEFAFNAVLPEQAAVYILDYIEQSKDRLNELVGADKVAGAPQVAQPVAQVQQPAAPVQQVPVQPQVAPTFAQPTPQQPTIMEAPAPVMTQAAPSPIMQAAPAVQPTIQAAPNSLLNALQGAMGTL